VVVLLRGPLGSIVNPGKGKGDWVVDPPIEPYHIVSFHS
jgi:hypothetical protein